MVPAAHSTAGLFLKHAACRINGSRVFFMVIRQSRRYNADMKKDAKTRIVVIGGGTGIFAVLVGLKKYFHNLTAIVTMADEGGSTGILREEFGILPPGDIRRALLALSREENKILFELFNYRFREGKSLSGHSFGNLMITALERLTGSFEKAVGEAAKMLGTQGDVLPVTLRQTRLWAELENRQIIRGETNIDIPRHDGRVRIKRAWLSPPVIINPRAEKAILRADIVVIGPGDLYTSLIPNILVRGVKPAFKKTRAKVVYLVNLMTKLGETSGFRASDFLKVMERYVGKNVIDYVVVSSKRPKPNRLRPYAQEESFWVKLDRENFPSSRRRGNKRGPMLVIGNLVRPRGFIRHDSEKTAKLIWSLV
ncbi:YvcK family protein [Candidatus Parcubacteria bacterium]|nr:MAG: YvcK family protein [Candidatus Parcubacteria bacterium]